MNLKLHRGSGIPIYLQIIRQILNEIDAGSLTGGARLPAVREMAMNLAVNPNTVAKAYTELQRANVVIGVEGKGIFVSNGIQPLSAGKKSDIALEGLRRAIANARKLGFSSDEIGKLFIHELARS